MSNSKRRAAFRAIWNPDMYHGWKKKRSFFEGWYIKLVDRTGKRSIAFIPGISMDANGSQIAFLQIMDGTKSQSHFFEFPADQFVPDSQRFQIRLGENTFSDREITLNTADWKGHITFDNPVRWPSKRLSPGVMGWYSFVPFMQCYHGVVSMDHSLKGNIRIAGEEVDFTGGRGYIEKDWGRSFPRAWVWMQTNHFPKMDGTSVMFSIAHIPWLGSYFIGFLCGIYVNGTLHIFTTYNRSSARLKILDHGVLVEIKKGIKLLHLEIHQAPGADLRSPISGAMLGKVNESMQASVDVKLQDGSSVIFQGRGEHAGFEMAGDVDVLLE